MAQQTINIGASPNDGTGTPLRTAFQYTNSNFSELYTAVGPSGNNIVVPGNATITGDLTVDTSTLKVDSANDRVGIKTATPRAGFALDVLGNVALGDSTTTTSNRLKLDCSGTAGNVAIMSFAAAGTNKAFYGLSGGFLGDTSTDAIVATDAAGAAIRFFTSDTGVEVARFNSTGNLAFANTKGIDFSATPSGSGTMTSELLNDYEEGTFVANITGGTTNPTTPVTTVARYTKIGRTVTVNISFSDVNTTGASGTFGITGLPFVNASGYSAQGSVISYLALTFTGSITANIGSNESFITIFGNISNAVWSVATHNAGASRFLSTTITYTVA